MKKNFSFSYSAAEIGITLVFDETKDPDGLKSHSICQDSGANKANTVELNLIYLVKL